MALSFTTLGWWFIPLLIWTILLKGSALWVSARNNHKWWFVFILVLNTVGILPLVYLIFVDNTAFLRQCRDFVTQKKSLQKKQPPQMKQTQKTSKKKR